MTAQMYYSLVGRGLEYEFQSFAEYHNIGILVWSPLAGGFLSGKYSRTDPAPAGTRFAEAGSFVPFDKEAGYHVVETLKEVASRHSVSPARVALAWVLGRPAVSSVIIAARKVEQLEDNISAVDLQLSAEDIQSSGRGSLGSPAFPTRKWMVLQLDTAEDPRPKSSISGALRERRRFGAGPAPGTKIRVRADYRSGQRSSNPQARQMFILVSFGAAFQSTPSGNPGYQGWQPPRQDFKIRVAQALLPVRFCKPLPFERVNLAPDFRSQKPHRQECGF